MLQQLLIGSSIAIWLTGLTLAIVLVAIEVRTEFLKYRKKRRERRR